MDACLLRSIWKVGYTTAGRDSIRTSHFSEISPVLIYCAFFMLCNVYNVSDEKRMYTKIRIKETVERIARGEWSDGGVGVTWLGRGKNLLFPKRYEKCWKRMREGRDIWRCDLASNWDRNLRSIRHAARSQLIKIRKCRSARNSRMQEWLIVTVLQSPDTRIDLFRADLYAHSVYLSSSGSNTPDFGQPWCCNGRAAGVSA